MYLLDSNVWITFLRKPHSPVVARLQARQPHEIRVRSPVAAELYYGCLRSAKVQANRAKIDALIEPYVCLPFDQAAPMCVPVFAIIWNRRGLRLDRMTCKSPPSLWRMAARS